MSRLSEEESKKNQPTATPDRGTSAPGSIITEAEAKSIALTHAGLNEADVKKLKCELDKDDDVLVYEVEFKQGSVEYEYEIATEGGAVVKYDVEKDD